MKNVILCLLILCAYIDVVAQAPSYFNYQAVVRDANGATMPNKLVNFKMSILKGSTSGTVVYAETFNIASNNFGIVNLMIGKGTKISGDFGSINWSGDAYYLKTEADYTGGTNYLFMGTTQLVSVPYSLYAIKAGKALNDNDTSSTNEIQALSFANDTLYLSNGGKVFLGKYTDNTDTQRLFISGNKLYIGGGNSVTFTGAVDLDADPTNELQTLSTSGNNLIISKGNSIQIDADTTNELQSLFYKNDTITISKGNNVILPHDNDRDSTNEIQILTISHDTIFLDKGGYIKLPNLNSLVIVDSIKNVSCYQGTDGRISLTVDGGYPPYSKFIWYNSDTTNLLNNLSKGVYSVSVSDYKGFSTYKSIMVKEPKNIVLTADTTNVSAYGQTNGAIDLTVTGGTPPYRYSWSNGKNTQDINNLTPGTYSVTVTDTNNCSKYLNIVVWCNCIGPLIDSRDSKSYPLISINNQCWFKTNLNVGTMITGSSTNNGIIEKYCYGNTTANCTTYGGMYDYNEAIVYQNVCPNGWHVPTDNDWYLLEHSLDTSVLNNTTSMRGTDIGTKLKVGGVTGFDALIGGFYSNGGSYNMGNSGVYMANDYAGTNLFWTRTVYSSSTQVSRDAWYIPNSSVYIRCIRDY